MDSITVKPRQVAEKAETHTLTFTVAWNHSSLTWMLRGGNKNTWESCKQWHQSEPKQCQKLLKTKHQVMGSSVSWRLADIFSSQVQFPSCKSAMSKLANHNAAKASWDTGVKGVRSGSTVANGRKQPSCPAGCRSQFWTFGWETMKGQLPRALTEAKPHAKLV